MATFAETLFEYQRAKDQFEDVLCDSGLDDFSGIGGDYYDDSIEVYDVSNAARLTPDAQKAIFDQGFLIAYLNHKDGWETHYTWGAQFEPVEGWRRKRTENGFQVNRFPESWPAKWLETGYIEVVS